jgi:hypothetical protein
MSPHFLETFSILGHILRNVVNGDRLFEGDILPSPGEIKKIKALKRLQECGN